MTERTSVSRHDAACGVRDSCHAHRSRGHPTREGPRPRLALTVFRFACLIALVAISARIWFLVDKDPPSSKVQAHLPCSTAKVNAYNFAADRDRIRATVCQGR